MDGLTLIFVGLMFGAAIILTLTVRSQILRNAERVRDEQSELEDKLRRRNAARSNPRPTVRR
ncbi:MAG TPA: hypothetical protein VGX92_22405 [Pyrinomonadaceae bacterium]|nr:hypothetical protein [Pyrinomonadaceae bacterium]